MFYSMIILIAVINFGRTQETPELDSVAILSGLSSSSLDCSIKFGRNFIESNEDVANAIDQLIGSDDSTREPKSTREARDVTREPCEEGEDCSRGRGRHRGRGRGRRDSSSDSSEEVDSTDVTEEASDAPADDLELRRNLGRGRRGRRRGDATREPLADGETREPRQTREPRDATKEPCADGEDCQRRRRRRRDDDSTKEPCDDDATTETPTDGAVPALRRLLRRGDRATREPLADGQTREPRDVTKEPCGRGRGRGHGRRDSDSQETTEDPVQLRRALRHGGRRRGSNLDATISNGIVEVAGIEGTVVFGEIDETLESVPLTLTLGETVFTCDVRVRGNEGDRVSCRATSEDEFKVRIGCAIEANEEL